MTDFTQPPCPCGQGLAASILIVEDEALIRMVLVDYLEECGFSVLEAGNATEAIAILEGGVEPVDLVFSDIRMPGPINGFGLARWLHVNRPCLPVILTSGETARPEADDEMTRNILFLAKPYDIRLLAKHIRSLLPAGAPNP